MNEPTMPEEPKANVGIHRDEDGSIHLTFGPGVTAADFITAFAAIPADHQVSDIFTVWYCEAEGCEGQVDRDEEHVFPVSTLFMDPAELPGPDEPAALVRCDCGTEMTVSHADLLSGRVTCCGRCGDRLPGHRCEVSS